MTVRATAVVSLILGVCLNGGPLSAHHAVAEYYDTSSAITLRGMVAKLVFAAPHCYLSLAVRDSSGSVVTWVVEGDSAQQVTAAGLTRRAVAPGAVLTVTAFAATEGKDLAEAIPSASQDVLDAAKAGRLVHGIEVVLADGRKISFGEGE
jgi:uncharacterized protein DUF6152